MQQIADWLEKLGMTEYAQRFAENRIDFSVLPDLTDQDLEKLGVLLGDRRKMLRAIANLQGAEKSTPGGRHCGCSTSCPADGHRRTPSGHGDVLRLSRIDGALCPHGPRGFRATSSAAYQKCVAETVRRFGGFVAKYMGDGVLLYFGYPQAHEDDAERATRAGLELIVEVAKLEAVPPPANPRRYCDSVSCRRGPDRVRRCARARHRGGDAEFAARLQGIAEPNSLVIANDTRELLGNLFGL